MTLKISRILHAGYVFECEDWAIAFDPVFENPFSRNCHAFPDVRFDHDQIRRMRFAAVFISHFHDDHCSFDSLDLLARNTPIYIYCLFPELFAMVRELGFTEVHSISTDVPIHVGPFEVIARAALDSNVDSMFQVRAAGVNVLNVVDAWIDPDDMPALMEAGPWDMVLWPFQTMREIDVLSPSRAVAAPPCLPPEWIEQLAMLDPRYIVPSSCQFLQEPWSWYNSAFFPISYRQFEDEVAAGVPAARVLRLDPSMSVELDAQSLRASAPLPWAQSIGPQDVDYCYQPPAVAPRTADIARNFPPLDAAQMARVVSYCGAGLLEKYRSLELEPDSYFSAPRTWRLYVYDHDGNGRHFDYRIEGDGIDLLADGVRALSWLTEVPAARLYGALEAGEALTSMYMRINDMVFDDASEAQIADADIVDDPLIRCLFDDAFGAYQEAQLRRLKARGGAQS
ncbi:MAG: MBL fold metallo-hydrolase [Pseudomonadota bacterium]